MGKCPKCSKRLYSGYPPDETPAQVKRRRARERKQGIYWSGGCMDTGYCPDCDVELTYDDLPQPPGAFRFRYSFHADIGEGRNLGLLVWGPSGTSESARNQIGATYYDHVEGGSGIRINGEIRDCRLDSERVQKVIDYYLERGGGGYQSFSVPEEIEADTVVDAARRIYATKGLKYQVPPVRKPSCSSCGGDRDLHAVTIKIFGARAPGRLLLYCARCRADKGHIIGVDVPLAEMDVACFVRLYRTGKTASAPDRAAEIVFGEPPPAAVEGAEKAMAAREKRRKRKP